MGMGMNFMGDEVAASGDGSKLMGMGWGRGNFCGDGVGMGLMSTTASLFGARGWTL